jgi:hypothetical protein
MQSAIEERVAIFGRYMERQRKFAAEGKQKHYLAPDAADTRQN